MAIVLIRGGTGAGRRADAHVTRALAVGLVVAVFGLAPTRPALAAVCGDGIVEDPETCDDGNTTGGDGCSVTCQIELGYTCTGAPSVCTPICGDGLVVGNETCDPPGSHPPSAGSNVCRSDCTYCGDSKGNDGEECDAGSANGAPFPACCTADCHIRAYACTLLDGKLCTAPIGIASTDLRTPTDQFTDIVRVRNKFRINTPFLEDAKIVFQSRFLWNPAAPASARPYALDTFYDRLSYVGLWMDNADYYVHDQILRFADGHGRVGMHSSNSIFPVTSSAIDGCPLPHTSALGQIDISGKDVTAEFSKGGTFTSPLSGWNACQIQPVTPNLTCGNYTCTPSDLPAGTYQIWNGTLSIDGTSYPFEFAVPATNPYGADRTGLFIDPRGVFGFVTEFFEFGTFVQAYVWDMEVQSANSSTWLPVTEFSQGYTFVGTHNSSGGRIGIYNNQPVLEFSNDGTATYYQLGNTFDIPSSVSGVPAPLPRVNFTVKTRTVRRNQKQVVVDAQLSQTSASDVQVALRGYGTALPYLNHDFSQLTVLTIRAGSLSGNVTFSVSGAFPGPNDTAIVAMHRSCGAMIGETNYETLSFR